MRTLIVSNIAILSATAASAHPDHTGAPAVGIAHYVTDPFHVALLLLGFVAAASLLSVLRARSRRSAVSQRRP